MIIDRFSTKDGFDFREGIYFHESYLESLCSFALPDSFAQITSRTFLVCSLADLSMPEQTLLINQNMRMVKTTRSLQTLFDEYGRANLIPNWSQFQETLHACIKIERRNFPYITTREGFLDVNKRVWLNINMIESYHRWEKTDIRIKTRVYGPNGCIVDLQLSHSCFQNRFLLDNCWLITYRGITIGYYEPNQALANIYMLPTPLSPLLVNADLNGPFRHKNISFEKWQDWELKIKLKHLVDKTEFIDKETVEKLIFGKN